MRHICISLVMALSAFRIADSCYAAELVRKSSSEGRCEALKGIDRVQTTCVTGPTVADSDPVNECLLECAYTGEFEKEDWKNIFCKTVDSITSWYTKNDERVTLQIIKDENLCKS